MSMSIQYDIKTREMHTGGEPLRIIESGYPSINGVTILDKIHFLRDNLDYLRKLLMSEPRGHCDMFGALLVSPDNKDADMATIFMHNEGYGTMCGHAVISLGRYAVDTGIVRNPSSPETRVAIQCPCGLVETFVEYKDGKTGNVRFNSVPAFVFALSALSSAVGIFLKKFGGVDILIGHDVCVDVPGYGSITVDIAYGGAFYAFVSDNALNLKLGEDNLDEIRQAAGATTDSLRKQIKLTHPESNDLAYLFGTIVTDSKDEFYDEQNSHVCVFADKQIDRSPCGSGTTARVALQFHKGYMSPGQTKTFRSPLGSEFTAKVVKEVTYGDYEAVVVEISGRGHYIGSSTFTLEKDDVIGQGFLL